VCEHGRGQVFRQDLHVGGWHQLPVMPRRSVCDVTGRETLEVANHHAQRVFTAVWVGTSNGKPTHFLIAVLVAIAKGAFVLCEIVALDRRVVLAEWTSPAIGVSH